MKKSCLVKRQKMSHVKDVSNAKLWDVHTDSKFDSNLHIDIICKSASNQLNVLAQLKKFLGPEERSALVNSFINTIFNDCPFVWIRLGKGLFSKIEDLQKRVLSFVLNDYTSSYEVVLQKSGELTRNWAWEIPLCIQVYKTLNIMNPCLMPELFKFTKTTETEMFLTNVN